MAQMPKFNEQYFNADPVSVYIPRSSNAWDKLIDVGANIADYNAVEEGKKEGAAAQAAAGPDKLLEGEKNWLGLSTLRSRAYDAGAQTAYTAQKKTALENSLFELQKDVRDNPQAYEKDFEGTYNGKLDAIRNKWFTDVPLHLEPAFAQYYDANANQQRMAVDAFRRSTETKNQLIAVEGRIDTVLNQLSSTIAQDAVGNEDKVAENGAELATILGQAKQFMSADKIVALKDKVRDTIAENYAESVFRNIKTRGEQLEYLAALRTGRFRVPDFGLNESLLGNKEGVIPMDTARRIASRIEEQAGKKSVAERIDFATFKTGLNEQTDYTLDRLQLHPELANSISRGIGYQDPAIIDDIRKAQVAGQVAIELRPLFLRSDEDIATWIQDRNRAINEGKSDDLYRDKLSVDHANKLLASKQQARERGEETQWLASRGLLGTQPGLNVDKPESIQSHLNAVREAEIITGRPQNLLDDNFIKSSKQTLETGSAADKEKLLSFVTKLPRTGDERARMFRQLSANNPELGQLAFYFANPDKEVQSIARRSLQGLEYAKLNNFDIAKDEVANRRLNSILDKLAPTTDPEQLAGIRKMTFGLAVDNARTAGRFGKTQSDADELLNTGLKQALLQVLGGSQQDIEKGRIPTINGTEAVPFKRGMSNDQMNQIWGSLTDDQVRGMNNGALPKDSTGMEVTADQIRRNGTLRYTGLPGEYRVMYPDAITGEPRELWNGAAPDMGGRVGSFLFRYSDDLTSVKNRLKQSGSTTLGDRLNNPGNIRSGESWQGLVGSEGGFDKFETPELGVRAMAKNLLTYQANGFDTINKIISRWAPENENDTKSYVLSVARELGVPVNQKLDLSNETIMSNLIRAIVRREQGTVTVTDGQIAEGIKLAKG